MIDKPYVGLVRPGQFVDYYGSRLFVPHGHFDEPYMLAGGKPETHVLAAFTRFVRPGDTVIDVGANIGTHSFALASLVGPTGRVYAVEADIDNAISLRSSIVESGTTNISLLAVAASDAPGLIGALATVATNSIFSASADQRAVKVAAAVLLDDLIDDHIAFIKLDIEGAELLALRGLARTIANSRPMILSEFSPAYITGSLGRDRSEEFYAVFAEHGYDGFYVDPYGAFHPFDGYEGLIEAQRSAFERLSWNHIDVLFAPREAPMAERGTA